MFHVITLKEIAHFNKKTFSFQKILGTSAGMLVAVGSFVGFFTFVTPLLIHWITKKYVTSLEYDPERDVYSATTLSFFLLEKKVM